MFKIFLSLASREIIIESFYESYFKILIRYFLHLISLKIDMDFPHSSYDFPDLQYNR